MIYVYPGDMVDFDYSFEEIFNDHYKPEWFAHPLVVKMLKEIDHVDYTPFGLRHEDGFNVLPERIAGGTKMLINMLFDTEHVHWETACGDNCLPFILMINDIHDVKLKFTHVPDPHRWGKDFDATFVDRNIITHNVKDFTRYVVGNVMQVGKERNGGYYFDPDYNND